MKQYNSPLWNTIGITSEREHVNRLWTGLCVDIQKGLWREKLHPEFSKYKDVLHAAELTEVIESIDKPKGGSKNKAHKSDPQPSSGNQASGSQNHQCSHLPKTHFKKKCLFEKRTFTNKQAGGSKHAKFNGNSSSS